MAERLFILDAHSLIYQVFHAIAEMTGPDGRPTNAVFGFVRDIEFIRRDKKPDYFVCAMDASSQTFRHDLFAEYKGKRDEMPDDLRPQIGMICQILEAYHIPILKQEGLEADDFLASVAAQARQNGRQIDVVICTADKDVRQCVNDHVTMYDLRRNRIVDANYVIQDWGVRPDQVVDFQSLVGDSTDNVPGVPGVGPKTATKLLQQYQTLDGVYEHLAEITGKLGENLTKGKESAYMSRDLVRLKVDIPLPDNWSTWKLHSPDRDRLLALFSECGFHRFADQLRAEHLPQAPAEWISDYRAITEPEAFDAFLKELAAQSRISFDLETTSINASEAQIVGYAISWEPGIAYYIAVRAPRGETNLTPAETLEALRPILENPAIEKIGQNIKYDMVVLRRAGIRLAGLSFDTMIASYLLEPGERNHNLDELSQRLLQHETIKIDSLIGKGGKGKIQRRMDQVPVKEVAEYAGEDADVAWRVAEILRPRIEKDALGKLLDDVEIPLVEVLAEMEATGIRIDVKRLKELSYDFADRIADIEEAAHRTAGKEFNLDSPTQLRRILFDELKLPVIKRTKTGPSTDQEVLEELSNQHEICQQIMEYRQLAKLKGTYLDALPTMINPQTGRIHASFNQTVAATGRLSSSDPNLQNIPVRSAEGQKIRQAFLPGAPGEVLLSADYSQIELRMLAYFSGDESLTRAFEEDQDIHTAVGAKIGNVAIDQVTPELRRRAKAVNFGIMYGLSPFGLAHQLKIDKEEAAAFIDAYFGQYPGIEEFFTRILEGAKRDRFVSTLLGRRRPITGIKTTTGRVRNLPERTAINTVIQGSAADLIKQAMVRIHQRLRQENFAARMLLQIHDELVFEVDADRARDLAHMVNHEMSHALDLGRVPIKVDVGIGPNWLDIEAITGEVVPA
ncbi:DNA polymerase I [bacterium]|nr:DNA polymerase I [bacterium]